MTCPELSAHYILVEWVFNIGQIAAIWALTVLCSFLWRKIRRVDGYASRPKGRP